MIKVEIEAGICGFLSTITADSPDMQNVEIDFRTNCPNLKPLEGDPIAIDAYTEAFGPVGETEVYRIMRPYVKHAACPVPMAMIKAAEAAAGLALPKDVRMTMRKEERNYPADL
jgi:hypothetical protein